MRFTIIAISLFPIFVNAQTFQIDKPALPIDSLKKVLPLLHDSARVDCLNELARANMEVLEYMHSDSAILLARQAYADAYAINYIKGLGDACLRQGLYSQWYLWNSGEMEKYFREAIIWYEKISDHDGLGHAFYGMGAALLHKSFPDEAKKTLEQSVFHFRKTGNRIMLAELIDQFGYVYNDKGDFEKFFENIKQGLREKKRINDNRGMIWSFYRLAHIYQSVGDFETALDYFTIVSSKPAVSQYDGSPSGQWVTYFYTWKTMTLPSIISGAAYKCYLTMVRAWQDWENCFCCEKNMIQP